MGRLGRPAAAVDVNLAGSDVAIAGGDGVEVQVCAWGRARARARRVARMRARGLMVRADLRVTG